MSDYIDNDKFTEEIMKYNSNRKEGIYDEVNENYIGLAFKEIATRYSYIDSFKNYPYRDDMVNDAIYHCLKYCHNFHTDKSDNAFAYFTTIIRNAFLRYIFREKKALYARYKMMLESGNIMDTVSDTQSSDIQSYAMNNDFIDDYLDNARKYCYEFELAIEKRKNKIAKKGKSKSIFDELMEE